MRKSMTSTMQQIFVDFEETSMQNETQLNENGES